MANEISKDDPQKKAMIELAFHELLGFLVDNFRTIKDCQTCRENLRVYSDGSVDLGEKNGCSQEARRLKDQQSTLIKQSREKLEKLMIIIDPLEE